MAFTQLESRIPSLEGEIESLPPELKEAQEEFKLWENELANGVISGLEDSDTSAFQEIEENYNLAFGKLVTQHPKYQAWETRSGGRAEHRRRSVAEAEAAHAKQRLDALISSKTSGIDAETEQPVETESKEELPKNHQIFLGSLRGRINKLGILVGHYSYEGFNYTIGWGVRKSLSINEKINDKMPDHWSRKHKNVVKIAGAVAIVGGALAAKVATDIHMPGLPGLEETDVPVKPHPRPRLSTDQHMDSALRSAGVEQATLHDLHSKAEKYQTIKRAWRNDRQATTDFLNKFEENKTGAKKFLADVARTQRLEAAGVDPATIVKINANADGIKEFVRAVNANPQRAADFFSYLNHQPIDVSGQYGLPKGYMHQAGSDYMFDAMPGMRTDSIWKAAEASLYRHLGHQPTPSQINALKNLVGDRNLVDGEHVVITKEQIEKALRSA